MFFQRRCLFVRYEQQGPFYQEQDPTVVTNSRGKTEIGGKGQLCTNTVKKREREIYILDPLQH